MEYVFSGIFYVVNRPITPTVPKSCKILPLVLVPGTRGPNVAFLEDGCAWAPPGQRQLSEASEVWALLGTASRRGVLTQMCSVPLDMAGRRWQRLPRTSELAFQINVLSDLSHALSV